MSQEIWVLVSEDDDDSFEFGTDRGLHPTRDADRFLGGLAKRKPISVERLQQEMSQFVYALTQVFSEAPEANIVLDEIELAVEVFGEGQLSLVGLGAKAGSKGAITLKFKRRE